MGTENRDLEEAEAVFETALTQLRDGQTPEDVRRRVNERLPSPEIPTHIETVRYELAGVCEVWLSRHFVFGDSSQPLGYSIIIH